MFPMYSQMIPTITNVPQNVASIFINGIKANIEKSVETKVTLNLIEEKIQIEDFPINLRVFKIAECEEFNNLFSIYNEKWFKLKP